MPGGAAGPGWAAHREPGAASISGTSSGLGSRSSECLSAYFHCPALGRSGFSCSTGVWSDLRK